MENFDSIFFSNVPNFVDPEKTKAFGEIKQIISERMPLAESLNDFYDLLTEISSKVRVIYENIQCGSGCSRCCKFYGSPQVLLPEWENIKLYLEKNFSENEKRRVKQKTIESINVFKEALEKVDSQELINNDSFRLSFFYASECPFLYKNICSIYEVRPFICRIFGNTLAQPVKIRDEQKMPIFRNILTCAEEHKRWEDDLQLDPQNEVFLLERLGLEQKLLYILKNHNPVFYTMQYLLSEYFDEY